MPLNSSPWTARSNARLKLRESAADAAHQTRPRDREPSAASSSENPLRMPRLPLDHMLSHCSRLKLRESAADAASSCRGVAGCAARLKLRESAADAAWFYYRDGYRATAASSSENPLRMPLNIDALIARARARLKLRESAADAAKIYPEYGAAIAPPQAPRIRCGCRPPSAPTATVE